MITPERPLCIYIGLGEELKKISTMDALYGYGKSTQDDPAYYIGETDVCEAEWRKNVPFEDRPRYTKFTETHMVRCMEPAAYYISLSHDGYVESRQFCEFHRPQIREL
jgi:hypothetical protein